MKRFSDDSGLAMVIAILVVLVVVSLSLVSFQLAGHDLDQSANERRSVQAIHASEAGIDRFLTYLSNTAPITNPACSMSSEALSTSPASAFAVTATYYSDANDPENSVLPCSGAPLASIPAAVKIRSIGTSAGRSRAMEAFVGLAAEPGGDTLGGSAVFADGSATWTGQATITNAVGTELAANLYTNHDLDLKGGGAVYGSVQAQGFISLSGTTDVKSFVTAKGSLSISNNSIVRGDARSTTSSVSNGGLINGSAYYCAGSAPGGTVGGSKIQECPSPPGPPAQVFPALTFIATDWQDEGYTVNSYPTCSAAQTFLGALPTGNYVVRVDNTCQLTIPNMAMRGNIAIISNGDIRSTGATSITVVGTPSPNYVLHLMGNVLNAPSVVSGPACSSGAGLTFAAGTNFPSGADVLFFTPCDVSFTGNATANIQGQIFSGGDVKFASGSNITFKPIKIPGDDPEGFGESLHYRREVSTT